MPFDETPFEAEEWVRVSREIRLHHECAHVVCRRIMPDDVLHVWDEVTADVVGLLFAAGRYDAALASRFLGVSANGFSEGRLTEYLDDERKARIDDVAAEVHDACVRVERKPARETQVDYAEDTMGVLDLDTGKLLKAHVFAACLPYSGEAAPLR